MRGWKENENPDLHHPDVVRVDGGDMRAMAAKSLPAGREPEVIICFGCGAWLDNTKSITREEAEQALGKRGIQEV